MGFFDDVLSTQFNTDCTWLPMNQFLFQLANIFLVFTYFVKPNSLGGLMQLRFALMMAGLCFGVWGGVVICALDCCIWNIAFAIGNALHLIYLIVKIRPAKFSHDHELLYEKIFRLMGVKRFQYKSLAVLSHIRHLEKGEYYATRGVSESNHIGIILTGSIAVKLEDSLINLIKEFEFVDSPEWIATTENTPTTYQVSLIANVSTIVYVWQREDLVKLFRSDDMLKNVFDSLIGKDICKKLFSFHQTYLTDKAGNLRAQDLMLQAPLLTYSAANLMQMFSNENTPYTSPRGAYLQVEKTNNYQVPDETHSGTPVSDDEVDICQNSLESENLILRETNL